jgi:diaminopimelate decarboxylase
MTRDEFYNLVAQESLNKELERVQTPCYLFFPKLIKQKIKDLKNCLGSRFSIHYAVKANTHPTILKIMAGSGLGADVASIGELEAALAAGIPPQHIEFSGPGKTADELIRAVEQNIGSVNAESIDELNMLIQLGRRMGIFPNVGIRINPDLKKVKSGLRMSGETQFGIPEEYAEESLRFLRDHSPQIDFTGIHVHVGSQILDNESITDIIAFVIELARRLEKSSGMTIKKINFGGGWGVNYFPNQRGLDLEFISEKLEELFQRPEYQELAERAEMIVEPGRFLVAESGVYATKVLYRKRMRTQEFAIVDGGMHHNYLLAGGMGQVIRRNFEMDILPRGLKKRPEIPEFRLNIAGRLCTPQDLLATQIVCKHEVHPGDYVVFFNCGAYGLSASPSHFLSHPRPAEIFCEDL